jgi:hypothetical protein
MIAYLLPAGDVLCLCQIMVERWWELMGRIVERAAPWGCDALGSLVVWWKNNGSGVARSSQLIRPANRELTWINLLLGRYDIVNWLNHIFFRETGVRKMPHSVWRQIKDVTFCALDRFTFHSVILQKENVSTHSCSSISRTLFFSACFWLWLHNIHFTTKTKIN